MVGSNGAYTPFKYTTDYRKFLIVSSGKITIKMTPFKNTKYLREAITRITSLEAHRRMEYAKEIFIGHGYDKIRGIHYFQGSMIYIPPYWWYSIKYSTTEEAAVIDTYNTIMNKVSYLPTT
jgi:hypothetical protein